MKHIEINKIDWTNRLVRTNEFASAAYTLPTDAHRILSVAISMIRQADEKFHTYRIYTRHLIDFFPGLKSDKNAIARIDVATDALMGSFIKVKKENGRVKRNLIHSCQLNKNNGYPFVDIRLDDDMLPFLIGITGWFSSPKIENIRHFKKENHFKLYAYFYSYLYRGCTGDVSLSEIRDLLSIRKSQYRLVGHLKSRLLDPSIELINRVTDIQVTATAYKHGRKIAGFTFDIKKSPAKVLTTKSEKTTVSLPAEPDCTEAQNETLSGKFHSLGFNASEFSLLINRFWPEYLEQVYRYVTDKKKRQLVDAVKPYIYAILKKQPDIDALLTPDCKNRQLAITTAEHEMQLKELELQKLKSQKIEFQYVADQVTQFLAGITDEKLAAIKDEFNQSIFASWVKFWQQQVDFSHHLVDATFKRYIYQKYVTHQ